MSIVKVYKENNFDDLVRAVENAQLKGYELSSIKFDCHRDPLGKVLFWYAVVIFDELTIPYQPAPPFPAYPQQPYYYGPNKNDRMEIICDSSNNKLEKSDDMTVYDYLKIVEGFSK